MTTLYSHLTSNDFAVAADELQIFIIPVMVVAVGLGLSLLVSCVSSTKEKILEMLVPDSGTITSVNDWTQRSVANQDQTESSDVEGGDISPELMLPMTTLEEKGCPAARIGSSADFDQAAGIFIVAGGMVDDTVSSDIDIYSVDEKKWVRFASAAGGFGFLYGYMGMLSESVVVFGGIGEDNAPRGSLQIYNFDKHSWERLSLRDGPKSLSPCPRFNGTASVLGSTRMVLFGGRDSSGKCLNDVWVLEMTGLQAVWTQLYQCKSVASPENQDEEGVQEYVPEPREAHSAVIMNDKLYVFGGNNDVGDILNSDGSVVEVFDLMTCTWSLHEVKGRGPQVLCCGGSAHALTGVNKVLLISGEESALAAFNGIFVLDLSELQEDWLGGSASWIQHGVQWCGDPTMPPDPRLFYAAAVDEVKGDLYIFGGTEMSPDVGDAILQQTVAVIDISNVMELLPDENGQSHSQNLKETFDGDVPPNTRDAEGESSETDDHIVEEVSMGVLFEKLTPTYNFKSVTDVANETVEDFEKIKFELDLAFARKYMSDCELDAMRKRLIMESEEIDEEIGKTFTSSCPLPKIKNRAAY